MIFVTGGTGMVGAHLLYYLAQNQEQIIAIKRVNSQMTIIENVFKALGNAKLLNKIIWKEADLLDYQSLNDTMQGCRWVYHSAALVSFNPRMKQKILANNVQGTANVVNAALAHGVEKFCHVSSIAALGDTLNQLPIDEDSMRINNLKHSNYSQSKYLSELEIWRGINEGLKAVIVNPSVILGVADWKTGSSAMFAQVQKSMKFYTKGITGFVDARDVAQCMLKLMQSKVENERFVLNSENLSYQTIFNEIADNLKKARPKYYVSPILGGLAWRLEALRSFLFKTSPLITKETIQASNNIKNYSNMKIKHFLEHDFIKMNETIRFISNFFIKL